MQAQIDKKKKYFFVYVLGTNFTIVQDIIAMVNNIHSTEKPFVLINVIRFKS